MARKIDPAVRERMTSVAFGLSAPPTDECAVQGCDQEAKPQVCPFDGRYHRHGMIHYGRDDGKDRAVLTYRDGGWRWICDAHYAAIKAAIA